MLFRIIIFIFLFNGANCLCAQQIYDLWSTEINTPYYKKNTLKEYEKEVWGTRCLFDVTKPTLTVFKAKGVNLGKAVIIIPGGGYGLVAIHHEGYAVAKQLAANGITAAVLKYRLPNPISATIPNKVPLSDLRKAIRMFRSMANDYGFAIDKLGLMGFSAGSHLATVAALWRTETKEEVPNYTAQIYGVTNLSQENMQWLEESLYFRKLTNSEIKENTLLDMVSKDTPPSFLVHAYDDKVCSVEETTEYAKKLAAHGVLVETHLFPKGGHGFGIGRKKDGTEQWLPLFVNWLQVNNL
ncbi:alpha/beta hydrolase [Tenacibaculum sp. SG-28]|uniref:alpha/beta hydrolase n=1 Tax=Tenacibaculum sp. SG-28 TaxID=754426 RepID=UPI000CF3C575|nr:alpha/beta hydrolase [Tenacibaculum sp. SG-28]PQJ20798.1 hypothetical protein BSU00_11025 [Tenacibaculum sp. SG-28]